MLLIVTKYTKSIWSNISLSTSLIEVFYTAFIHHNHLALNEPDAPKSSTYIPLFEDKHTFMYAGFEVHLLTNTAKSIMSSYKATRVAQEVYREFNKHSKSYTADLLSGDT